MFVEDVAQFFDTDDFAVTVTKADASTFSAIFDNEYMDPLGVAGTGPRLVFSSAVGLARDASVTVAGVSYTVVTLEPDGTGVTIARLQRA